MTYTWPFNPRPYSNDEAAKLLSSVVSPETADWHYNKHHQGYVVALNAIEKGLEKASKEGVNGNYAEYAELKRRQPFNHAGTVLHDTYWKNLGGDGDESKAPTLKAAIEKHFGSFDAWKEDFVATAMSAKLSGWGILTFDRLYSERLLNVLVDEHQNGAIWGGVPIISIDMFEHAYYHKDGPARPAYIKNFLADIHWGRTRDLQKILRIRYSLKFSMESKISIITLGVLDLKRSIEFYKKLGFKLQTEENTEHIAFFLLDGATARLALFPRVELANDIGISHEGSGFSGFTIAHNVGSPEEVDATLFEAETAGAKIVKKGQKVFWGGYSGYFSDPDGFLWEVAHNPFMDLT